jgi:opacity protein-like surface antigen
MAGVDVNLTPRIALVGDARYIWSAADKLNGPDYFDYTVDLSGAVVTLGLTFRL